MYFYAPKAIALQPMIMGLNGRLAPSAANQQTATASGEGYFGLD